MTPTNVEACGECRAILRDMEPLDFCPVCGGMTFHLYPIMLRIVQIVAGTQSAMGRADEPAKIPASMNWPPV